MAKRGPSLSVKMILTSTLLIVLIVVGFGFLNVYNTRQFYEKRAEDETKQFFEALSSKGKAVTAQAAKGLKAHLIDSAWPNIDDMVKESLNEDAELKVVYVLDKLQGVVSHSDTGRYQRGDTNPEIKDESWGKILQTWNARAGKGESDPMIENLDLTTKDGRLLYFAYPIAATSASLTAKDAVAPVEEAEARVGYVVLGYTLAPLARFEKKAQEDMETASYNSALRTGAVGGLFVLIGTVLAIFQGLSISKPLKLLAWRADQIARGDLEARVEVTSTDEIGLLGENFNYMADQLNVLLQETAEKATLEKELEVARTIQETLVPPNDEIERGLVRFAGYFEPASQCGGDWWTYHDMVGDKLLVVIGDVTGHGVPSAMITATAKAAVDVARDMFNDDVTVTKLLEIMNTAIFESAKRKFVMTCFASIIDPHTRTITYANAGHNFPYIYRVPPGAKRGEFGSLMIRGNRLGDMRESKFEAKSQELLPGDTIIWYTDGIVECESIQGEEYGEKRFRASIRKNSELAPADMRDSIVSSAMDFYGDMPRKDDITMVVGKVIA
ncbi:MAG: SpoIIE family protein phosphatase [Deltaproteobacteria bacterium]|nr:SpoIIE family protein phosphatase [Deltaproteobacteria bacterium]